MRGRGTSFIAKFLLASSAAFVPASATTVLLPTQASAQINIDGLIRGALRQRGYGYHAPSHHSSSSHHESDSSDDDPSNSKAGKGVKSTNDGDAGGGGSGGSSAKGAGGPQSASSGGPPGGGGSGGGSSGPAKTSDDMPSFTPSR